jgi:periplasmic divalent cation tolerance protein
LGSNEKDSLSVIYVSASSVDEAKTIAKGLLENDLVACVSLIPQVTSMYMWEGKMEDSSEVIMMIKVS